MDKIKGIEIINIENIPECCEDMLKVQIAIGNRCRYDVCFNRNIVTVNDKESGEKLFNIDTNNIPDSHRIALNNSYSKVDMNYWKHIRDVGIPIIALPGDEVICLSADVANDTDTADIEKIGLNTGYGDEFHGKVIEVLGGIYDDELVMVKVLKNNLEIVTVEQELVFKDIDEVLWVKDNGGFNHKFNSREEVIEHLKKLRRSYKSLSLGYVPKSEYICVNGDIYKVNIVEFHSNPKTEGFDAVIYTIPSWYIPVDDKTIEYVDSLRFDSYGLREDYNIDKKNRAVDIHLSIGGKELNISEFSNAIWAGIE